MLTTPGQLSGPWFSITKFNKAASTPDRSSLLTGLIRDSAPQNGRLFVCEHIVSEPETPHFSKLFDIHMMCWGTGRERTSDEYKALLERSGWTYVDTFFPAQGLLGVVEGAKA